jgi:hypothetical protein
LAAILDYMFGCGREYGGCHPDQKVLLLTIAHGQLAGHPDVDLEAFRVGVQLGVPSRVEAAMPHADHALTSVTGSDQQPVDDTLVTWR